MMRTMFKSKIHRATVTQADLHYVGSVTIDEDLLDAANLLPGELVHIVDIDNGARLETYTIAGPRGTGVIGINGAAARLVHTGDLVIIIAYAQVTDEEARSMKPHVVFVDGENRITGTGHDAAEVPSGPAGDALRRGDIPAPRAIGPDEPSPGEEQSPDKAARKTARKSARKSAEKGARKTAATSARKAARKAAEKAAAKAGGKAAGKATGKAAGKAASGSAAGRAPEKTRR